MLPRELLRLPKEGCIGLHPTALPERIGGAPINWCLIDNVTNSGITLFYMDETVDAGDIIAQAEMDITPQDTCQTLLNKIGTLAARLVEECYPLLERGVAPRIPQAHEQATYTRRRRPEQGEIYWGNTSLAIYNWVRALTKPFPGAFTWWEGGKLLVWQAEMVRGYKPRFNSPPGEVLDVLPGHGFMVSTADSYILIKTVQLERQGGAVSGDEFAQRHGISPGSILGVR
jgi:methionyl-tRNA formyltransferase